MGMGDSSSWSPYGLRKTELVSASQLAWCGAVTTSPQSLSVSHSLLGCSSSGQAGVHSILVKPES
ncbi:hypothetical protein CRENBAI_012343 [Crenichthys baileyi]|uniref:Uncharacterized protein n=1 Tax=Crenichthys baileyi TaxID=28760 RepID=A0AAV9S6P4_9TELE